MENVMRSILAIGLALLFAVPAVAEPSALSGSVKASLVFREDPQGAKHYGYPRVLLVYLRIENISDSSIYWFANSVTNIKAELLDSLGMPVSSGPGAMSITFNSHAFLLPYGSRLDWLISNGGISLGGDRGGKVAILVGGQGWLIPINSIESYSLSLCLYGILAKSDIEAKGMTPKLLLEVPPIKVKITQ